MATTYCHSKSCLSGLMLLVAVTVWIVVCFVFRNGENPKSMSLSQLGFKFNVEPMTPRRTDWTRMSEDEDSKRSNVAINSRFIGKSKEELCSGSTGRGLRDGNPLCANHSSLIVFSRMKPRVVWQLYDHKEEAEKCVLPNNAICFLTNDYSYYKIADVLLARDCSDLCNRPAYPNQLFLRYNRGPGNAGCRLPSRDYMRVSYTLSSTIPYPYMCWPDTQHPLLNVLKLDPPSGRHGVVMFISDPKQWREKYLEELMKYIHIDSYGGVLHNTDMHSSRGRGSNDFISVKLNLIKEKGYKFLIAFEKSIIPEYVSEKIWHAYLSQTIPIYYGTSDVYDQVPGANTFIDATKFDGPRQLAEYIKKIEQDDSLYKSFFNFDINQTLRFQKNCPEESLGCAMCKHLYQIKQERCNFI